MNARLPLIFVLVSGVLAISGCWASDATRLPQPPASVTSSSARLRTVTSPLDDPLVPNVPIAEALARIGRDVPLPPDLKVSKAVLFESPDGSGAFELTIRYATGEELYVRPGNHDFADLQKRWATVTFRDGMKHVTSEQVGSRSVLLNTGGTQSGVADGHVVRPVALWNESGLAYDLYSPETELNSAERLTSVVSSIR